MLPLLSEDDDVAGAARARLAAASPKQQTEIVEQLLAKLGTLDDLEPLLTALASTRVPAAWKELDKRARSKNADERESVLEAISYSVQDPPIPDAIRIASALLGDPEYSIHDDALDALEHIASPEAIPALLALKDPNVPKLVDALVACGKNATDASAVVARLSEWLDGGKHANYGYEGCSGLGAKAVALVPKLEKLRASPKAWEMMHATCALQAITGDRRYLDEMVLGLGHKSADARIIAKLRLEEMGPPVVVDVEEAAANGKNQRQRGEATKVLQSIRRKHGPRMAPPAAKKIPVPRLIGKQPVAKKPVAKKPVAKKSSGRA